MQPSHRRSRVFAGLTVTAGVAVVLAMCTPSSVGAVMPPPALAALEQKMGELKVSSERFSMEISIKLPHSDRKLLKLLKLFGLDSRTTGEVTFAPEAANVEASLFGARITVREVGETQYVKLPRLARADGGRPWVKLGSEGLGGVLGLGNGSASQEEPPPSPQAEPKLAEPPFQAVANILAGAREVREVGGGTVDDQAVTSFLAVLEPSQLKRSALASAARRRLALEPPTVTLEVAFTEAGLPIRTIVAEHRGHTNLTVTLEIPAIDFPLTIEAPPAAETIDAAELRELGLRERARERSKHAKGRHPRSKK